MDQLEAFLDTCIQRLENQSRELGQKLTKTDQIAHVKVIDVCMSKMKDFIETLGLRSLQVVLNEKEECEDTIALQVKTMKEYTDYASNPSLLEEYRSEQYTHEERMKALHMLYSTLTEDYLRRVMGVHMQKRVLQDEMHNRRAIFILRHAIQCFKTSKKSEFGTMQELLKTMSEEEGSELMERMMKEMRIEVDDLLEKNEKFMREYRMNNIKINAELLEDAHKISFPDLGEDFAW